MRVRGQSCSRQRCKRPLYAQGLCKTHLREECDRRFSLLIRNRGRCQSNRANHAGDLQCAHGFSRSYKAIRWDTRNAWALCAGCHTYFTHHPIEWDLWMLDRLGVETYGELRELALTHRMPDLEVVLMELAALA